MSESVTAGRRVLIVSNDPADSAVYRYRCENIADVLRGAGWSADVAWIGDARVRVDHDIVVLHRICAVAEGRAYARAARACGATLVYGADDLVFEPEAFPDPMDARKRRFAPLHAAMAREADAVLVSTEFLAARARMLVSEQKPVFVIRNFLSPELFALSEAAMESRVSSDDTITLGYLSGTPTHDDDLATIAAPLAVALRKHADVRLLLVGSVVPPAVVVEAAGNRLEQLPFVPWRTLPTILSKVDINLAPLDLNRPFNHAKSEIKLLEAAAVGVPTIAAAGSGFREFLAEDTIAVRLAETTADWEQLLDAFVSDRSARIRAAKCVRELTRLRGTSSAYADSIGSAFAHLVALNRPQPRHPIASVVGRNPLAPRNIARRLSGIVRRSA